MFRPRHILAGPGDLGRQRTQDSALSASRSPRPDRSTPPDGSGSRVDRLIVFDFDNTLVHSRIDFAGIRRDLIALFRRARVPGADDSLARLSIGQIIDLGV